MLSYASILLSASDHITVATGIAILWARDPIAMANASRTLADAYPGRFLLGIGVSHETTATARGHQYQAPVASMRAYLEAMRDAPYDGFPPAQPARTVIAALGPKMIGLASELADGIHPFLVPPDHTASARDLLEEGRFIGVEQAVIPTSDPAQARGIARENLARYMAWPNYRTHLGRLGFDETDLAQGGSNRLIDALYAWGNESAIRRRVDDHLDAGANHVCIQVVPVEGDDDLPGIRNLAPALLERR